MTDLDREITIPASLSPLRSRIVRAALAEVGVVEEGGNNRGPAVETYQRAARVRPGGAWCGAFCRWVYERADSPLAPYVLGGVARTWRGWPLPYVAATGTIYADLGRVQPGDLAVFARATSRTRDLDAQRIRGGAVLPAHIGIVVEVGPAGYTTVEGNVRVQPRGVRPGDGVAVRDHGWAEIGTVGWLPAEKKAWTAAEWNARHAQGIRVRYYQIIFRYVSFNSERNQDVNSKGQ